MGRSQWDVEPRGFAPVRAKGSQPPSQSKQGPGSTDWALARGPDQQAAGRLHGQPRFWNQTAWVQILTLL